MSPRMPDKPCTMLSAMPVLWAGAARSHILGAHKLPGQLHQDLGLEGPWSTRE